MVARSGARDSGANASTTARREAYANDLDADRSLVAVTTTTDRGKADQDPADWLPPLADTCCTRTADRVATKLRRQLSVDDCERAALAREFGQQSEEYEPAPQPAGLRCAGFRRRHSETIR
ncbi:hypothetical protein [Streptomyces sp. NPDC088358]|uniref:hypothetical protein n=1 Tax=Streptomyces sp. NPDC088358 TaxID=3365857 RepID=UPI00380EC4AD